MERVYTDNGAAAHVAQDHRAQALPRDRAAFTGAASWVDTPRLSDAEREQLIEDARLRMLSAATLDSRILWCRRMIALIRGRSAEQVERMEAARGLG